MEPITVTCFCHNSCCLSFVVSLTSLYFRKQCLSIWHAMLSDNGISHGSVATQLRYGEICNDVFIANFLLSVTVKNLKIGHYLAKLLTRVWCLVFLDHGVYKTTNLNNSKPLCG